MEYLLGKQIAIEKKAKVLEEVKEFTVKPKYVVLVNKDDPSSLGYVRMQEKNALSVGIEFEQILMEPTNECYFDTITRLNNDDSVTAIMVTRPLFKGAQEDKILSLISPFKDVDAMNPVSLSEVFVGKKDAVAPATAQAICDMLDYYHIDVKGKDVLVIGRSLTVGKPVGVMLLNKNATITFAHTKTVDLDKKMELADIIIAAVGKPLIIDGSKAKDGAIIIDAGIHYLDDGRIVGDVKESNKLLYLSKVPGGVGSVTSSCLMENILKLYKKQRGL